MPKEAKGSGARSYYVRVPAEDREVMAWIERQENRSMSIRALIRLWISEHGIDDLFLPAGPAVNTFGATAQAQAAPPAGVAESGGAPEGAESAPAAPAVEDASEATKGAAEDATAPTAPAASPAAAPAPATGDAMSDIERKIALMRGV